MIGRGAQGAPWRLAEVAAALTGAPAPKIPEGLDFADMVSRHYEAMLTFYGTDLGNRVARKHLGWYMDRTRPEAALRTRLLTTRDPQEALRLIPEAMMPGPEAQVAA